MNVIERLLNRFSVPLNLPRFELHILRENQDRMYCRTENPLKLYINWQSCGVLMSFCNSLAKQFVYHTHHPDFFLVRIDSYLILGDTAAVSVVEELIEHVHLATLERI